MNVIAWIVKVIESMSSKWNRRDKKVRNKREGKLSRKIMTRADDRFKAKTTSKANSKELRRIQRDIDDERGFCGIAMNPSIPII